MGVLYYAEYLHIFERARSQFIRDKGLSYVAVEERGVFLPVREAQCRYRRPFRYDDLIRANAGITQWGKASLTFRYVLWNEARDVVMAEGMTQHACVNKDGRPTAVPDWLKIPCSR
jgi:acyl-CoA thioester hydrolase